MPAAHCPHYDVHAPAPTSTSQPPKHAVFCCRRGRAQEVDPAHERLRRVSSKGHVSAMNATHRRSPPKEKRRPKLTAELEKELGDYGNAIPKTLGDLVLKEILDAE